MVSIILKELSNIIDDGNEMVIKKECVKDLISLLESLKLILEKLEVRYCSSSQGLCDEAGLVGLRESLKHAQLLLNKHKCKRRLYWTICLESLNKEVENVLHGVGNSLRQLHLEDSTVAEELDELVQKMEQVSYEVVDGENKLSMLAELSVNELIVRFSHDLGINFERDRQLLSRELRYFKTDIESDSGSGQFVSVVDDVLEVLACDNSAVFVQDGGEVLPSFEAFECPLTKQIMKDPVVLQSGHTYEKHAIEEWFNTCRNSNRPTTCPISGMALTTTELQANVVLRKTIEEWYQRSVALRIDMVYEKLKAMKPMQDVDAALDELLRLMSENSTNKSKLKKANLIPEIAKIWTLDGAAYFRSKALAVLQNLAVDDVDNQTIMVKEGLLRNAIRSLGSREEEEKANAAKLLCTLSEDVEISAKLATEKGGVIHLVGLTASKVQGLAATAEKTLKNLEKVDANILEMAEAGRLQPLLTRLREGTEDVQVQMAKFLGKRHLVKSQKTLVAQSATDVLLGMLESSVDAREASVEAFLVVSSLEENRRVLINAGLLSPLLAIMFNVQSSVNKVFLKLKESAAAVVCNLVSSPGHWENVSVDAEGNTMHSEFVVHSLLGLMEHVRPNWKDTLLHILLGLISSPKVADEIYEHMRSGYGIKICFSFLSAEPAELQSALKLLATISTRMPADIIHALHQNDQLHKLKELLKSRTNEERGPAACILANLPLTDKEVSRFLEPELIAWTVETLSSIKSSKHGRSHNRVMSETAEGLLGILLHFLKCKDPNVENELRRHDVMRILVSQLEVQGQSVVKLRAALGIKYLSDKAPSLTNLAERRPPTGCFCFSPKSLKPVCPVHLGVCEPVHPVCMIESRCLVPVLELLEEEDERVQVAGLEALSTLVSDDVSLAGGVEELAKVDGLQKIVELFYGLQRGEAQDKCAWLVERVLRVEECSKAYTVDTRLFRALVETFKSGNPVSKALAQDALTNLKQLSGVSAGNKLKKRK